MFFAHLVLVISFVLVNYNNLGLHFIRILIIWLKIHCASV